MGRPRELHLGKRRRLLHRRTRGTNRTRRREQLGNAGSEQWYAKQFDVGLWRYQRAIEKPLGRRQRRDDPVFKWKWQLGASSEQYNRRLQWGMGERSQRRICGGFRSD